MVSSAINAETANLSPAAGRSLCILLADDEVLARMVAADTLRGTGHEVVEAVSGDEALDLLSAGLAVDLVVSNAALPGSVGGLQLVALIAELYPDLPVLLAAEQLPALGTTRAALLAKPYSQTALLAAVREVSRKGA